jgi:hypothetical protein
MDAYQQGRIAFAAGMENSENPYPKQSGAQLGQKRVEWFNGWFDEWRWRKYGPNEGETYVPLRKAV